MWRERGGGGGGAQSRGLSCACFQASTDKSRPVHLVKQLATARSKSYKASTADVEGVPLARCINLQKEAQ